MTKKGNSIIRTIYLYIFALVGLAFLISGAVRFIDMGLKAFIFTKAEEQEKLNFRQPTTFYSVEKVEGLENNESLTEEERALVKEWLADYKVWKEDSSKVNYVEIQRQRNASSSLASILVGLPLYLYHWGIIKEDIRKRERSG
ncbi:MAG: hypothetical protein KJI70_01050 [Patescibacteria group bacterium]|nr:hypothetical protein [Patescibacteria group bacterium]